MAYRYGDRQQRQLFPQSIDEYVADDAPVRAYDAIVEALDFAELGIALDPNKVGHPEYDPKAMLKLLVYGYSYGIRSSRKLEQAVYDNLSFIWLVGGLKPDHKTIAEYRRRNKTALKQVLRQTARICIQLDLIEGNTLFVDGTKVRASAGRKHTWSRKRCEAILRKLDRRIDEILTECDRVDESEQDRGSRVKLNEELKNQRALQSKVQEIVRTLDEQGRPTTNTTDPDCRLMKSMQGSHPAYNVQSVVDDRHGLIVHADAVQDPTDIGQFAEQVEQADSLLRSSGRACQSACADSGYCRVDELEKVDAQGIQVIVPSQRQAEERPEGEFEKSRFRYDWQNDSYICPEGETLTYSYTHKKRRQRVYRLAGSTCRNCRHFGRCTINPQGRSVIRLEKEDLLRRLERQHQQPLSQAIYKRRKARVELPFGHLKRNLKVDSFLLRGLEGVRAEASILAGCFNVARLITLLGVKGLIARLAGI